jgi:hypothetical protein
MAGSSEGSKGSGLGFDILMSGVYSKKGRERNP